ncbi:response regulator transcription factor [Rhodopirellula sallentina]|uniref:Two component transcriptional regulator, LuxR family n=1 Tax=Rhodopirellula sallentina SM41 TaxID=1263870 RepID=M5UA86_9BACT|nr:response regulator [Rhodopirellula sallentina]EMI54751.1 two component transcriptional regulator, LuxR family [Rhodopirellula sallentina SM41]
MQPQSTTSSDEATQEEGPEPTVFLVDDHEVELDLMQRWCQRAGLATQTFDDPLRLLETLDVDTVGCVVADLRMPRISGLELQAEMAKRDLIVPVVLVTGHGDAENCRTAFQQGVFDFIEKGFDSVQFIDSVERAIRKNQRERFRHQVRRDARSLLETVSKREREVVMLLANGMPLKGIAHELKISVQTASKHRSSIFTKLHIDNEVDLYKLLLAAEVSLEDTPAE